MQRAVSNSSEKDVFIVQDSSFLQHQLLSQGLEKWAQARMPDVAKDGQIGKKRKRCPSNVLVWKPGKEHSSTERNIFT
jgi:hypothetical protein